MSDGSSLRETWYTALNNADTQFRGLITSPASEWRRVGGTSQSSESGATGSPRKGKARASSLPELSDVVVHRKIKDDIYRLVLEVPTGDEPFTLEPWKAVLTTPELRAEWDPAVTDARILEVVDHTSRICKTNFTLGWPANPRDTVTISRTLQDTSNLIDLSISLPRSPDEPAYLRPSPPYVRSHVALLAWCIQHVQPTSTTPTSPNDSSKRNSGGSSKNRIRITCFWHHDLKAVWNIPSSSGLVQQLSATLLGLFKTVLKRKTRVPKLVGFGNGVAIDQIRWQNDREALTVDYSIIPDDDSVMSTGSTYGIEGLQAVRDLKRLTRSIECILPANEGWDAQVSMKASSEEVENAPWEATATKRSSNPLMNSPDQVVLRLTHAALPDAHSVLKVRIIIEISGPSSGLRVNGFPHAIEESESRDPSSSLDTPRILPSNIPSIEETSVHTGSSLQTANSMASVVAVPLAAAQERTLTAEKSILSRVRRNYIYFSSLLQEPEAKWKRTTEARGVTITQLDSIDPTLVVYRAEATFVGVGLWDLFSAVLTPGARNHWDKQHEDATLLEDVNELTELWHFKTKPAWPVVGRDSVVLRTVYKSPTTIHVFSFSADSETHLFPNIPTAEANVIRTQVDLQGWAIEALSPNTTQLTLLEQSDPKGWTNKTSIPTLMVNSLAGIGDFAIKCGGPPVVTRLAGAKAVAFKYDHERLNYRAEYEPSVARRVADGTSSTTQCELRCDLDTWAPSLDIVVDPPPQAITGLRRHRLSSEGGGLWLTITHDGVFMDDERVLVIVRRGPGREKGLIMVNGAKLNIDVEELPEVQIKSLSKRRRVKPTRIPLDQPPVAGVIRRRKAEWNGEEVESGMNTPQSESPTVTFPPDPLPKFTSPLSRFFTFAVDQAAESTKQAVAVLNPSSVDAVTGTSEFPSSSILPTQHALDALSLTQDIHAEGDWITMSSDNVTTVRKKIFPRLSPSLPVVCCEKVIEGVSAEELAVMVTESDCRKKWDERFVSSELLEAYGCGVKTSFHVSRAGYFPFRDRGFFTATVVAKEQANSTAKPRASASSQTSPGEPGGSGAVRIFCVTTSFDPQSTPSFSTARCNPLGLPVGRVFLDAWIFETLDPYTKENFSVPSSRCTHLVCIDLKGSAPAAVNASVNQAVAKSVIQVEGCFRSTLPLPVVRLPSASIIVAERPEDDSADVVLSPPVWQVAVRDDARTLLHTKFTQDKFTQDKAAYICAILIEALSSSSHGNPLSQKIDSGSELITPKPSRVGLSQPTGPSSDEGDSSSSPSSPSPAPRPTISTLSSRGRSTSTFSPKNGGDIRHSEDFILAELVVDTRLYPNGYKVSLKSKAFKRKFSVPLRLDSELNEISEASDLPIACSAYVMPASQMHSSGLSAHASTRHLLRLTIPTSQYDFPSVTDPLTGETRSPPPRPAWLNELTENGALTLIEVSESDTGGFMVGTTELNVMKEKEALSTLGREELLSDKTARMAMLSKITGVPDAKSNAFIHPIAVSNRLLSVEPSPPSADPSTGESATDKATTADTVSIAEEDKTDTVSESGSASINLARTPSGLLSFLQSYPNPLARFNTTFNSTPPPVPPTPLPKESLPGAFGTPPAEVELALPTPSREFKASTTLILVLIAFLMGSLLRSLLSPADFIYIGADDGVSKLESGWREVRRLFEVKYIFGGWDLQIAVVRRH